MNQTLKNRSGTDTEVIATLTAISQVSAKWRRISESSPHTDNPRKEEQ